MFYTYIFTAVKVIDDDVSEYEIISSNMIFKTKIVTKLSVLLRMIILFETLIYKNKFIFLDASTAFLDYFNQFGVRSVSLPSLITRTSSNHE